MLSVTKMTKSWKTKTQEWSCKTTKHKLWKCLNIPKTAYRKSHYFLSGLYQGFYHTGLEIMMKLLLMKNFTVQSSKDWACINLFRPGAKLTFLNLIRRCVPMSSNSSKAIRAMILSSEKRLKSMVTWEMLKQLRDLDTNLDWQAELFCM